MQNITGESRTRIIELIPAIRRLDQKLIIPDPLAHLKKPSECCSLLRTPVQNWVQVIPGVPGTNTHLFIFDDYRLAFISAAIYYTVYTAIDKIQTASEGKR